MKIYLATDHAGFQLKEQIREWLVTEQQYEVIDKGNTVYDAVDDYPDFVALAAREVSRDPDNSRAVVFGWSGQGEAIVANRFPHVRAAVCTIPPEGLGDDVITLSREHNNSNVLSLGSHFVTFDQAKHYIKLWLETKFTGEERHHRRLKKIDEIDVTK